MISGKEVGFVLEKKKNDLFIALGRLNLDSEEIAVSFYKTFFLKIT